MSKKKAEPFRVTGPGRYRMQSGREANLIPSTEPYQREWTSKENPQYVGWNDLGESGSAVGASMNLIARIDDEPAEMAGIGFTEIEPRGEVIYGLQHWYRDRTYLGNGTYVDWSKVPASAIVKPEPKIETRKVWLVMKDDGWMEASKFPPLGIACNAIAIVEREITFTHGEGLGSDP